MDMESITPDAAPEAIPNASPIEGEHLPAVEVAFTARRIDTKINISTLHHLPKHSSDVLSTEEGTRNCHKRETIEYEAADAG